ncbi:MAG TPA: crosslink repair DNA glycosylase YcaQ family protein, partial [Rhodanobacteraceae bacterium]
AARLDALIDIAVRKYAPLPATSLGPLVRRLRYGAPQWRAGIDGALVRAKRRLAHARVDGVDWYWPADEEPRDALARIDDEVRMLAPFDPIVWDRARFERFWGWAYRFEAYTPVRKRKLGYYALPLLWRATMVGWANVTLENDVLDCDIGYVAGRPPSARSFKSALDREVARMRAFLGA